MLKLEEHTRPHNLLPLTRWLRQTLVSSQVRLKLRLRGNNLHLLCEGNPCPDVATVTAQLIQGLTDTPLDSLLPADHPPIYQVLLYGRTTGSQRPAWTELIYLNQLDRYLEHLESLTDLPEAWDDAALLSSDDDPPLGREPLTLVSVPTVPQTLPVTSTAIVVSNQSLARQGDPEAIARYLSETLSTLGISVTPKVRTLRVSEPSSPHHAQAIFLHSDRTQRLCIYCESTYRVDPAVVAERIAIQLRGLNLSGFRDALVFSQVRGESQAEWVLRVDLTPPDEMLREWARWGDLTALTQIVSQALGTAPSHVSILQQETTLYLFCRQGEESPAGSSAIAPPASPAPDQATTKAILASLLTELAPQGAKAAAIYGLAANTTLPAAGTEPALTTIPAWVDWIDLPGAAHEALAVSTRTLAEQGDLLAIVVLLTRQLNPNLDQQLATGGTRVQVLRKGDLIHVMADAPRCPRQAQVGPLIASFIRQLRLGGISGVRVYGRRAGQKRPRWCYGVDFVPRNRLVPEATPEFAASDTYVGDLLASASDLSLTGPTVGTVSDLEAPPDLATVVAQVRQTLIQRLQQMLIQWQLCVPRDAAVAQRFTLAPHQNLVVAVVWGALGLVLTVQVDWLLGRVLQAQTQTPTAIAAIVDSPDASVASPHLASAPMQPDEAILRQRRDANAFPPSSDLGLEQAATARIPLSYPEDRATAPSTTVPEAGFPHSPATNAFPDHIASPQENGPIAPTDSLATVTLPNPESPVDDLAFNASEFTRGWAEGLGLEPASLAEPPPKSGSTLQASAPQDTLKATAVIAAAPTDYPSFSAQQLDQKLALYRHHLQSEGPPDVLIIGSSRALRGVDPTQLQQALQRPGRPPLRVFNFGINGATAQVVDLIVRQLLRPEELPRLMIWADGARAFNSGRVDITFNAIAASDGYRQLQAGTLPPLTAPAILTPTEVAATPMMPLPPQSLAESYQQANAWLSDRLAQASAIHRDRYQLKNWLGNSLNAIVAAVQPGHRPASVLLEGQPPPSAEGVAMDAFVKQAKVDINGFLPLSVQFNPATYYQQYARVPGTYDSDYANFTLLGQQHDALLNLLRWTREHDVEVVFVNLPLTDTYLDPVRMDYEREFQAYLTQQELNTGLLVRDWSQIWLQEYLYFSDPSHLNRYGAYAISQRLAQDPRIPWPIGERQESR
ncbi:hypothetical protein [Trichothermofontia sp.]